MKIMLANLWFKLNKTHLHLWLYMYINKNIHGHVLIIRFYYHVRHQTLYVQHRKLKAVLLMQAVPHTYTCIHENQSNWNWFVFLNLTYFGDIL